MPTEVDVSQPAGIGAEIASHPPLMQQEAGEKYIGREVDWRLSFSNGSVEHGQARLTFHPDSRAFLVIVGTVSLSEYPWLKSLQADEILRVRGRIRKIDPITIHLDISKLSHEVRATSRATVRGGTSKKKTQSLV